MRNIWGALAQRKLTRAIISTLTIAGIGYQWQHAKSRKWLDMTDDDSEIELSLRGLSWQNGTGNRTLIYNLTVPLVENNVDLCLFNLLPANVEAGEYKIPNYVAWGNSRRIDPAAQMNMENRRTD